MAGPGRGIHRDDGGGVRPTEAVRRHDLPGVGLEPLLRALGGTPGATRPATIRAVARPLDALQDALDRPGPTVVAGSLYLVGTIRAQLVDDPALRDPNPKPGSEPDR